MIGICIILYILKGRSNSTDKLKNKGIRLDGIINSVSIDTTNIKDGIYPFYVKVLYKNIEEKIRKNLQKIEFNTPFSSTGMANKGDSNANSRGTVFSLSQNFAPAICVYQSLRKKLDVLYTRENYYHNHHLSNLNFSEQFSVRPPPVQV